MRHMYPLIFSLLITLCAVLPHGAQAQSPAADMRLSAGLAEYQIGPENVLQIDVYYGKNERISQKVRVSSSGIINFPLIGELRVHGLTVAQVQDKLTAMLGQDYLVNPQVTVFLEEYSTVSIMGEVTKPGLYPVKGKLTVLELISMAEGFTRFAAPTKIKLIHTNPDGTKEERVLKLFINFFSKKVNPQENIVLSTGDVVIVPESLF